MTAHSIYGAQAMELKLSNLQNGPVTIVDDDFLVPDGFSLTTHPRGYAVLRKYLSPSRAKKIYLHRFITGATMGQFVDHINRNKLDNRRVNLRFSSIIENARNRPCKSACFITKSQNWRASVRENYKRIILGHFSTEREAIECSNQHKLANWGEFAVIWPLEVL